MEEIDFLTYQNNQVQTITFQDLALNKRVLICSIVRPTTVVADEYVNYMVKHIPFYKSKGIDEVYLITSAEGLFGVLRVGVQSTEVVRITDVNCNFVKWLSNKVGKTSLGIDALSKYWSYQVLLNNGKVEHFQEQPTENYIRHLIKEGHKPNLHYQKFFITEGDKVGLFRASLTKEEQNFTDNTKVGDRCTPLEFMYFNLCPNKKLNEYLLDTQV